MPTVFLSYRRDDSRPYAARLCDGLITAFGPSAVFMDLDSISPGRDFVEVITEAINTCDVVLVVIGKEWAGITNADGQKRLENPQDWVRVEVATALARPVTVIPVLVGGAAMPQPAELPAALAALCRRQAFELSDRRWKRDVKELIETIRPPQPFLTRVLAWARRQVRPAAKAALVLGLLAGVVWASWHLADRFIRADKPHETIPSPVPPNHAAGEPETLHAPTVRSNAAPPIATASIQSTSALPVSGLSSLLPTNSGGGNSPTGRTSLATAPTNDPNRVLLYQQTGEARATRTNAIIEIWRLGETDTNLLLEVTYRYTGIPRGADVVFLVSADVRAKDWQVAGIRNYPPVVPGEWTLKFKLAKSVAASPVETTHLMLGFYDWKKEQHVLEALYQEDFAYLKTWK